MPQFKVLVMRDKKNAYVLSQAQSHMPMAELKNVLARDKKYTPCLHCFHPEWYIEEHWVVTPRNLPNYFDARTMLMGDLRKQGFNII